MTGAALVRHPPTVRLVEGAYYWIEAEGDWRIARLSCGWFYETGRDDSTTPTAISGPIERPDFA